MRTSVQHFPGLTSPVKEIGFAEVKEKSLTSVGFRTHDLWSRLPILERFPFEQLFCLESNGTVR